jgi:hypothetical protein
LRHALVQALRNRGIDISTALDAGTLKKADDWQLAYAAAQGMTIYSFNVGDFCRLHAEWLAAGRSQAGIIPARQKQFPIGEQMRRLVKLVNTLSEEEMRDRLEFLGSWG